MKTVKDLMVVKIRKIQENTSVPKIVHYLFKQRYYAVPVVDKENRLVGIVSEQDIIQKFYPQYPEFVSSFEGGRADILKSRMRTVPNLRAKDVLNRTVFTIQIGATLFRALSKMSILQVSQLPVVSPERVLLGMIYKNDIFHYLFNEVALKQPKKQ